MSSESSIEKTTTAESELLDRRLFLRSLGKWSGAAIVAAVGGGVWISSAPEARAGGWVNRRGAVRGGAGSTAAAAAVVGLIGALVAEAAGSIAGRQLYRNRCVPQEADKPLRPKAGFRRGGINFEARDRHAGESANR
jgi:hypothetical protein